MSKADNALSEKQQIKLHNTPNVLYIEGVLHAEFLKFLSFFMLNSS